MQDFITFLKPTVHVIRFFAIFDAHGGPEAGNFARKNLRAVVCKIRAILKRRCHTISPNWLKIGM